MSGIHIPIPSQSIELDCPPGATRPWDLIVWVCEGTDLPVTNDQVPCCFGLSSWVFDIPRDVWERDYQPIIIPRIKQLHHEGVIRWGSW